MTGYVVVNDKDYGKLTATRRDTWAADVAARLQRLGLDRFVDQFAHHVEMKAAMAMIVSGARTGQVTINHMPCGAAPGERRGCHATLPEFLPKGSSLTVLGTDTQGQPFHHTYEGRAHD